MQVVKDQDVSGAPGKRSSTRAARHAAPSRPGLWYPTQRAPWTPPALCLGPGPRLRRQNPPPTAPHPLHPPQAQARLPGQRRCVLLKTARQEAICLRHPAMAAHCIFVLVKVEVCINCRRLCYAAALRPCTAPTHPALGSLTMCGLPRRKATCSLCCCQATPAAGRKHSASPRPLVSHA